MSNVSNLEIGKTKDKPAEHMVVASFGGPTFRTTRIYTHVLNRGPAGVRSPVDELS